MIDMGTYKTFYSQTFRCHFDPDNRVALSPGSAAGPDNSP